MDNKNNKQQTILKLNDIINKKFENNNTNNKNKSY